MGEAGVKFNYGYILFCTLIFVFLIFRRNNAVNKINLLVFALYTIGFIIFGVKDPSSRFKLILAHALISVLHLIILLFFNFKRRK